MKTIILSPRFSSDTQAIWQYCIKNNKWNTYRVFKYQVPENIINNEVTVFGEMQFCDIIASRTGIKLLEPPNNFLSDIYDKYGDIYTQRNVSLYKHSELKNIKDRKFIKPANDKVFIAGIYEQGSDVPYKYIDPNCPVLVSDIVNFEIEYRCYILDKKVQTLSCYEWIGMIHQENPDESEDAKSFAQNFLDNTSIKIPSAFVLDVGRLDTGKWAIIEANQAYASGIYHEADVEKVLEVIERSASKDILEEDSFFIRDLYSSPFKIT